jgi:multidrug efflux pump subunit AcrA (membrane-fusion protein)
MTNEFDPYPQQAPQADHDRGAAPEQKPISPRLALIGIAIVLVVAAVLAGVGILTRFHAEKALAARTTELAAPTVIAAIPKQGAPVDSFVLPGNVTAWTDSPIYARTSGYLTRWYFDIGARVKKGALLAVPT